MIDISGHLRLERRDVGFENKDIPIEVNCAGYQSFNDMDFVKKRPHGRLDYQFIYVVKGSGWYFLDGQYKEAKAGSLILYKPGEVQLYKYFCKDAPEIYWIHFTGSDCERILDEYQLVNNFYCIGSSSEICTIFKNIMFELQLKKHLFEKVTQNLFDILLLLFKRNLLSNSVDALHDRKLDKLILHLNDSYAENWSIREMADFCNMSESRFQHLFREKQGVSAKQFILRLRLEKAKSFLLHDNLTVGAVAKLVGFNDQLYFSRIFKKYEGLSPRDYSKS